MSGNRPLHAANRAKPDEFYTQLSAIENVDRLAAIPTDHDGVMGVPFTFLDKHNPDQFEILGMDRPPMTELTGKVRRFHLNGREMYVRLIIRRRGMK